MTQPATGEPGTAQAGQPMPIVFYDGECGFCNSSVRFVLNHEQAPTTRFAPIQGETAAQVLSKSPLPPDIGNQTMVVFENGNYLVRSRAVLRTMELMGGGWVKLARVLRIVPISISDAVYRLVAKMRGELPAGQSCELLPPEQQKRFLP